MSKKLICILLLGAMLASVSCGSTDDDVKNDTTASDDTAEPADTVDPNSRDAVKSAIPSDLRFDGETVTVLTRDTDPYVGEFLAEEENGDTMNDAIYKRNIKVEDQLGVKINVISRPGEWGSHTQFNSDVVKDVMAGDTSYDVISYYAYAMPMIAQQNVLYNLNDLDNIDLSKPWWHQHFIENAEIYGKLYAVAGDIDLTTISYRSALFFNKTLAETYYPDENFYQLVLDGKWTQEYLINLTKDTWNDLNANDTPDAEDFFGLDLNVSLDSFPIGGGLTFTKKTSDGGYEWDLFNEHNNTLIERFYDAYNNNNGIFFIDKGDDNRFIQSNSIFYGQSLNYTEKLRDMRDEYGILPMPKFDENQEQYYSVANDNYSQIAIPSNCRNTALAGAFIELMGEYSYKYVTPAYYEVAMKGKYLRDDESCRMFDIIVEGAWYDFANINTSVLGDPVFITRQSQYHINGKNFASIWAENESKLTAALESLLALYQEN